MTGRSAVISAAVGNPKRERKDKQPQTGQPIDLTNGTKHAGIQQDILTISKWPGQGRKGGGKRGCADGEPRGKWRWSFSHQQHYLYGPNYYLLAAVPPIVGPVSFFSPYDLQIVDMFPPAVACSSPRLQAFALSFAHYLSELNSSAVPSLSAQSWIRLNTQQTAIASNKHPPLQKYTAVAP